jgi:nucleoid-associated protein YgaU
MKYRQILFGLAVAAVLAGCSPQLAQAPLGPKEEKWAAFIDKHYPGWEAPQTTPPGSIEDPENTNDNNASTLEVLKVDSAVEKDTVTVDSNADGSIAVIEKKDTVITANPVPATEYIVKKGDSLYKISQKVYGSGNDWKKIYEANSAVISNPKKLKVGTKLLIPQK